MDIQNLKTRLIGPVLLLIPMACMHLGEDHHSGPQHSSAYHPSYFYSIHEPATGSAIGSLMTQPYRRMAQEGTQTPPEGEKGG